MRVHASSGTHGKPTVVGYTRGDLENWTELMARCMTMAGVRPGMVIHNANGYGLFTGGLGFHQGGERIGATVVPVSGGRTARQAMLLRDLGAQVLVSTPSYALVIAQAIADAGDARPGCRSSWGCSAASRGPRACATRSSDRSACAAVNFYGLSEMCGPGVAAECPRARRAARAGRPLRCRGHRPGDGRPVPPGAEGELVFTTLANEAMPLLRYRTGDIGTLAGGRARAAGPRSG